MSYIAYENDYLLVKTPYHAEFIAQLKTLPYTERKWDGARKAWTVHARHLAQVSVWIESAFGVSEAPVASTAPRSRVEVLEVRYIGQCKERDNGEVTALGSVGGTWSVIFPEDVLQRWFNENTVETKSEEPPNKYRVLGLANNMASVEDIRTAYRRMARQWHPDVCKEPNAQEQFIAIQSAYELLANPLKRAKYDAALNWLASGEERITRNPFVSHHYASNYRSPLRCGVIRMLGIRELAGLRVKKIMEWQDIVRGGQVLVTSWPRGADTFREEWVEL